MPQQLDTTDTIVRSSSALSSEIDNEVILLSLEKNNYYGMDSIATKIWSLIEQPMTIKSLICNIIAIYDVNADQCEHDLLLFLNELLHEELIQIIDE